MKKSVKHEVPAELKHIPLETLLKRYVRHYKEIPADWDAFADSQIEGRRRAQFRFIGAGGSGKEDPHAIPASDFTLSIMRVPPGQGGSAHTHEVAEAFICLEGELTVFFEDLAGKRVSAKLGQYDTIACPPGVPHGFHNDGKVDVLMQTIVGAGKPGPVGYIDESVYAEEQKRLAERKAQAVPAK